MRKVTEDAMQLYPLKFEPIFKEKVWGGRRLERLGKRLPGNADARIGESWELADMPADAGGESTRIVNGPLAGRTLRQALEAHGSRILGRLELTEQGLFPLLVKFLDARENLSVQVHPPADYVRGHPGTHLKSEAWYVLDAEPGAVIYKGLKEPLSREQFEAHIRNGTVIDVLAAIEARPGTCHYLPAGTCHALGAGVLVAEVQTPSDTTFRIYDWGRTDREIHLEQALQCVDLTPTDTRWEEKKSHMAAAFSSVSKLLSTEHFRLERIRMSEGYAQEIPYSDPVVWLVLEGAGTIELPGAASVDFARGDTMLIPAGMTEAKLSLREDTLWLEVQFPQIERGRIARK